MMFLSTVAVHILHVHVYVWHTYYQYNNGTCMCMYVCICMDSLFFSFFSSTTESTRLLPLVHFVLIAS